MDDFNVSSLHESKNEWASRLVNILTPLIIEGIKSIFNEANNLCIENDEKEKYLMTFQNFISRIPKWNPSIIEEEKNRIIEKSGCNYLEELVTCVHIIQLKLLTAVRVGHKQKKINISIPKLNDFIHTIYINSARKVYSNIYLFQINIQSLQLQKYNRELEILIQECILNTVRDNIPIDAILKAYLDETIEEEVIEEIIEEEVKKLNTDDMKNKEKQNISDDMKNKQKKTHKKQNIELPSLTDSIDKDNEMINTLSKEITGGKSIEKLNSSKNISLSFNEIDYTKNENGKEEQVNASKNIERLENISIANNLKRKADESSDTSDTITISNDDFSLMPDLGITELSFDSF